MICDDCFGFAADDQKQIEVQENIEAQRREEREKLQREREQKVFVRGNGVAQIYKADFLWGESLQ